MKLTTYFLVSFGVVSVAFQQPRTVETVRVEIIDSMPNHRTYVHPKLVTPPPKSVKEPVVYQVTNLGYRVGEEDLNYFPYSRSWARDFNKMSPKSAQARSVTVNADGSLRWDLAKLNRLLAADRQKENKADLKRLKAIDPKKAKLLESFQTLDGVYTATFSEYGLSIHLDRKTGCFNDGDPESKGKHTVEPAVIRELEKFLGSKVKLAPE